jgi:hypothetical protein
MQGLDDAQAHRGTAPADGGNLTVTAIQTDDPNLAELILCRQEIMSYHEQVFRMENYAMIGVGGMYAWLIVEKDKFSEHQDLVFFIPFLLILLVYIRIRGYKYRIARQALYIARLENKLSLNPGWEHFVWHSRSFKYATEEKNGKEFILKLLNTERWEDVADHEKVKQLESNFLIHWGSIEKTWYIVLSVSLVVSIFLYV